MMKTMTLNFLLFLFSALLAFPVLADVQVTEGNPAKALYAEEGKNSPVLSQVNKAFVLKSPDGTSTEKPEEVTIKAGDFLFILNEEEKTIHNIYDATDYNWVLKKQLPSSVAAVKFEEPGIHELRCAIHPGMKVKVTVDENDAEKVK